MRWFMRKRKGFTLIELLVVILILAILMAIGLPLYLKAVADSEKKTCRANMQTIANAEQAYKVRSSTHKYVLITGTAGVGGAPATYTYTLDGGGSLPDAEPFVGSDADLLAMTICPKGGAYQTEISTGDLKAQNGQNIPDGGLRISCDYNTDEHGVYAPGVDSN